LAFVGENATEITDSEENGHKIVRVRGPRGGGAYFGFRITDFVSCPPGKTLQLKAELSVVEQRAVRSISLCLREWAPDGPFLFQTTAPMLRGEHDQEVTTYLTAREAGLVYEGSLLAEASDLAATLVVRLKAIDLRVL
jgi:hypothetical protein